MQERTAVVGFAGAGGMLYRALPGIGPIRRLEASIQSMFVCFGKKNKKQKKIPEIGAPPRVLGVPLAPRSLLSLQRYTAIVVLSCTL